MTRNYKHILTHIYKSVLIVIITITTLSCNTDNHFSDPQYPTRINELNENELNNILAQVEKTPLSHCISIDYYGYLMIDQSLEQCIYPEWQINLTENEIKDLCTREIFNYASFLNLNDDEKFSFRSIKTTNGMSYADFNEQYPDSVPNYWIVTTNEQVYNSLPVRSTYIKLLLSQNQLIGIGSQWYQSIYFPGTEGYTEDEAKELLMGKTFTQNQNTITIDENTNWHTTKEIIQPVRRSKSIELHICYVLCPENREITFDKYTGEIITQVVIN